MLSLIRNRVSGIARSNAVLRRNAGGFLNKNIYIEVIGAELVQH